ncbi:MOSC domain-containing protein [Limibacillus halophilus]|uniref:MOSC domain-containing protein n=1 Tax=Limibacillus halophilus TaxID=1579333 RepID=A0A839SU02_9PROT|nr:MOSC domain-containing protein [Limibacillus halophilus]MBB3066317.1 hypothetical protein [Limibacillus halophilus]
MNATLEQIWRYPVKSLDGQALQEVSVAADCLLPHDRRFAISYGSRNQVIDGRWASKNSFFNLMRDEKLAQLRVTFDVDSGVMSILRGGRRVAQGNVTEPLGRMILEQFLTAYLAESGRGPVKLQERHEHGFTDVEEPVVSLVNLASISDLERVLGQPADPRRFRANLLIAGLAAWEERSWLGKRLRIGDVEVHVMTPIGRCAATEVNPESGRRDLMVLKGLARGFSHSEMGVYARIIRGGKLGVGDTVERLP